MSTWKKKITQKVKDKFDVRNYQIHPCFQAINSSHYSHQDQLISTMLPSYWIQNCAKKITHHGYLEIIQKHYSFSHTYKEIFPLKYVLNCNFHEKFWNNIYTKKLVWRSSCHFYFSISATTCLSKSLKVESITMTFISASTRFYNIFSSLCQA